MISTKPFNKALTQLDIALRSGRLDLAEFRARRRQLIADFEDGACTTTPDMRISDLGDAEHTVESDTESRPDSSADVFSSRSRASKAPVYTGVAVFLLLAIALGWLLSGGEESQSVHRAEAADAESSEALPLGAVNALLESQWTDHDIRQFANRWQSFPPEVLRAASDDPRIWLLRGQTKQKLRDARETESLSESEESSARVQLLEQIQDLIRPQ